MASVNLQFTHLNSYITYLHVHFDVHDYFLVYHKSNTGNLVSDVGVSVPFVTTLTSELESISPGRTTASGIGATCRFAEVRDETLG